MVLYLQQYVSRRSIYIVLVLLITLVGAFLRFYKIGDKGLWLDEILALSDTLRTIDVSALPSGTLLAPRPLFAEDNATKDFHEIWLSRSWEPHPPLYFSALKIWIGLLGSSDAELRSFSAFCSILIIPMGFLIARYLTHTQAGLLAAILLATSPVNIYYGQENKGYALLALLVLISFYCLVRMQREPKKQYGLGYILSLAAALYLHYFAFWILLAQATYVASQKNLAFKFSWLKAVVMAGILFLPWLPQFLAQRSAIPNLHWLIVDRTPWVCLLNVSVLPFKLIFSKVLFTLRWTSKINLAFSVELVSILVCFIVVKNNYPRSFRLLVCWIFVPLGALLALDLIAKTELLTYTRYTFMLTPAIYLLLTFTLASLKKRYQIILLSFILLANFFIISRYYKATYKIENWKEAASYIEQKVQKGDLVVIYNTNEKNWKTSSWLMCLGRYFPFRDHPFLLAETPLGRDETLAAVNRFERIAWVAIDDAPFPAWILKTYSMKEEARFTNMGTVAIFINRELAFEPNLKSKV